MLLSFFRDRWNGRTPLPRLLWHDMLVVGTLLNLSASLLALFVLASDGHAGLAVTLHLAPLPYNIFLLAALQRHPASTFFTSTCGVLWFVAATLV
jgi:hypothetical protein